MTKKIVFNGKFCNFEVDGDDDTREPDDCDYQESYHDENGVYRFRCTWFDVPLEGTEDDLNPRRCQECLEIYGEQNE